MSERHITRHTLAGRRRGKTDWERVRRMSEAEIERGAEGDMDNPPWTAEELDAARLSLPAEGPKIPVSIRLDSEIVEYFKGQGPGYQSRINAVLLAYVRSYRRKGKG